MKKQPLPRCHRHPRKRCPGDCQYILARGLCIHELNPGDPIPTYEGTLYPESNRERRAEPSQPVRTTHAWSDGWPQRCTRCYQLRHWDETRCAGRPAPIVIDMPTAGRASDG